MDQIETLKKLGMIDEPKNDWDVLIKTLGTYNSPQARKLYDKLNKKYNIPKVEELNRKDTNMIFNQEGTQNAPVESETPTESTDSSPTN